MHAGPLQMEGVVEIVGVEVGLVLEKNDLGPVGLGLSLNLADGFVHPRHGIGIALQIFRMNGREDDQEVDASFGHLVRELY